MTEARTAEARSVGLHARLMARQPKAELERKWAKAQGRWSNRYWAQELLDLADREAEEMCVALHGLPADD